MSEKDHQLDSMEALLERAAAADEAGVFESTRIDAALLLRESWQEPVPLRVTIGRKWIPFAAAIGLAAILWPVMYQMEFASVREKVRLAEQQSAEQRAVRVASHLSQCVTGPMSSQGRPCGEYDYDSDGDIDLADYGRHQLVFAQAGG